MLFVLVTAIKIIYYSNAISCDRKVPSNANYEYIMIIIFPLCIQWYTKFQDISIAEWYGMVWYGNILFDIVHNIIENILTKHNNI